MHGATEEDLREMLVAFDTYIARRSSPTMDDFTRQDIARVRVRRGTAYAYLRQWQSALADLDAVIAGTDAGPAVVNTASLIRADVYTQTEQRNLAIADYSRLFALIEQVPPPEAQLYIAHRVVICLGRGKLYALEERYEEALADFDDVLAHDPGCAEAYSARGLACAYWGRGEQALSDCNRALELEQAAYCYHRRGVAYTLLGDYWKALSDLNRALELDPANAQIHKDRTRARWPLILDLVRQGADLPPVSPG
jgi:tetratricopeptide (TPR) repeat protein